jgi:hypothetical protein
MLELSGEDFLAGSYNGRREGEREERERERD